MSSEPITGGCLCGQLRYVATGTPTMAGLCFCADCRKASGSAFIPFIGFEASALAVTGEARQHRTPSLRGSDAVRSFCPDCGGLVFGGALGEDEDHTVYAGTLDDRSRFVPAVAIFVRDKPDWFVLPELIAVFETMPGL